MKKIKTTIHLSKECKDMLISVAKSKNVTMSVMAELMIRDRAPYRVFYSPLDKSTIDRLKKEWNSSIESVKDINTSPYFPPVVKPGRLETMPKLPFGLRD